MTPGFIVGLASEAIKMTLLLSAPLLGVGLIVGLVIAILQATTQVQEMTISFVPKIVAVLLVLLATAPWMLAEITSYTNRIFSYIPHIIR